MLTHKSVIYFTNFVFQWIIGRFASLRIFTWSNEWFKYEYMIVISGLVREIETILEICAEFSNLYCEEVKEQPNFKA